MYEIIKTLHSYFVYCVVVMLLIAIGNAVIGFLTNKKFTLKDLRISLFAIVFSHLQLLMEIILYFTSIKGFKYYLQIERSLSDNSVQAYISDVKKFANYAIPLKLSELKITRENISSFLTEINKESISARSQARIISGIKAFYKYLIITFIF